MKCNVVRICPARMYGSSTGRAAIHVNRITVFVIVHIVTVPHVDTKVLSVLQGKAICQEINRYFFNSIRKIIEVDTAQRISLSRHIKLCSSYSKILKKNSR